MIYLEDLFCFSIILLPIAANLFLGIVVTLTKKKFHTGSARIHTVFSVLLLFSFPLSVFLTSFVSKFTMFSKSGKFFLRPRNLLNQSCRLFFLREFSILCLGNVIMSTHISRTVHSAEVLAYTTHLQSTCLW